jgi:hypothetical protein
MEYIVRKYYSSYCNFKVNADDENSAYLLTKNMPIDYDQILETIEGWEDCNEVELAEND